MSTTRILSLVAVQRPFEFDTDENDRHLYSMNLRAHTDGRGADFEGALAELVEDTGQLTIGTDLFIGPKATVPTGDGPYAIALATGGLEPAQTHGGEDYDYPTGQIIFIGRSHAATLALAEAVYAALDGLYDLTLDPDQPHRILESGLGARLLEDGGLRLLE